MTSVLFWWFLEKKKEKKPYDTMTQRSTQMYLSVIKTTAATGGNAD